MDNSKSQKSWIALAIASGACAAFNGVFAKLTTTELTSSWAGRISEGMNLNKENKFVEYAIRALFFGCNLLFNAIMWGLFTRALTLATSTVRVSIMNTSANFMITALLGLMIFSETLPGLWWIGASMLVAGSVIIGRREEHDKVKDDVTTESESESSPRVNPDGNTEPYRDEPDNTVEGNSHEDDSRSSMELESIPESSESRSHGK